MNCDGVRCLLSAYIDGELTPGELLRVEQHLRRCHACADEVDSLRQTIGLVASLDEVEVPATFSVQLHERLVALGPPAAQVRRRASRSSWPVRKLALPTVAAAAALAIGLSALNTGEVPGGLEVKRLVNLGEGTKPQNSGSMVANSDAPGAQGTNPSVTPSGGSTNTTNQTPSQNLTGGQNAQPIVPDTKQPEGPAPMDNDAHVATTVQETTAPAPPAGPQYRYTVAVTAATSDREGVKAAIAARYRVTDTGDGLTFVVPAAEREAAVQFIQSVQGLVVATVKEDRQDIAEAIHKAQTLLYQRQSDTANYLKSKPAEPGEQLKIWNQGLEDRKQLERDAEVGLERLEGEVRNATIFLHLQVTR